MNKFQKVICQIVKDDLKKIGYNPSNSDFRKERNTWEHTLKGYSFEYVLGLKNYNKRLKL